MLEEAGNTLFARLRSREVWSARRRLCKYGRKSKENDFFTREKFRKKGEFGSKLCLIELTMGHWKIEKSNFPQGKAFVECETVIIEETMAARGECRSIDVTFESADIWTLRRREPRLTALDGWWRTIWWNRIGVHVHGTMLDWSIFLHRNSKPTVLALRSTEINAFHELAENLRACKCPSPCKFTGDGKIRLEITHRLDVLKTIRFLKFRSFGWCLGSL